MTIAVLLLLPVPNCNTTQYCDTNGNIIYLKKTKDFHKALVLMTFSVEILFESHTIAVIFDDLSAYWHQKYCIF